MEAPMQTLRSIQYLRGVAALMVVLFHAFQWARGFGLTATDFPTGGAGVDIFFVISGFVMWATTEGAPVSPLEFLRRRAVRIVPPYWAITLLAAGLAISFPVVFQDVHVGASHLVMSLFFIPHFDPGGEAFPVLKPGWTLVYEACFYLIFAVGLLVPGRARPGFLAFALAAVALGGFFSETASVLLANLLMLEFLVGILIANVWREGLLGTALQGWGLALTAVAALAVLQALDYRDYNWRPFVWGVPAGLLVCGLLTAEAAGALPRIAPLKLLGDASYSIYLCHPLAFQALGRLAPEPSSGLQFVVEAVVLAIVCGLLGRHLIEKPTLRWLNGVGRAMPGFERAAA
jgi:exopolysaccharide production protein ExoZ